MKIVLTGQMHHRVHCSHKGETQRFRAATKKGFAREAACDLYDKVFFSNLSLSFLMSKIFLEISKANS